MRQSRHLGTFTGEAHRRRGRAQAAVLRDNLSWIDSFTATGILVCLAALGGVMLASAALRVIAVAARHAAHLLAVLS